MTRRPPTPNDSEGVGVFARVSPILNLSEKNKKYIPFRKKNKKKPLHLSNLILRFTTTYSTPQLPFSTKPLFLGTYLRKKLLS